MSDFDLLCKIVEEIKNRTNKPVNVKHRIGIDGTGILENDRKIISYEELLYFIDRLSDKGINKFIIHSRIAILKGLTPDENRKIPALDYETVYRVKKDRPNLHIEINGGVKTVEEIDEHLKHVDSVMLGREIYDNPMILTEFGKYYGSEEKINITRKEIIEKMIHYVENMEKQQLFLANLAEKLVPLLPTYVFLIRFDPPCECPMRNGETQKFSSQDFSETSHQQDYSLPSCLPSSASSLLSL